VLQFLLGLSDRQAAEAVRCRIDFKHAMAMELDDPGFHHSVLADFRDRLAEDGRADRLLDLALARLSLFLWFASFELITFGDALGASGRLAHVVTDGGSPVLRARWASWAGS
jgi:hypothetical protein